MNCERIRIGIRIVLSGHSWCGNGDIADALKYRLSSRKSARVRFSLSNTNLSVMSAECAAVAAAIWWEFTVTEWRLPGQLSHSHDNPTYIDHSLQSILRWFKLNAHFASMYLSLRWKVASSAVLAHTHTHSNDELYEVLNWLFASRY